MLFNNVILESMGSFLPEEVWTTEKIESQLEDVYKKLRLPFGRLELMTGIKSRRIWSGGTRPSYLSTMAAKNAFSESKLDPSQMDILIHSSVCRDFLEPATASVIHHGLDLSPRCLAFDLSNACLGAINAMVVLANMIEVGKVKAGLIVSGENGGPLLLETIKKLKEDRNLTRKSIKKYIANLTIGSGASAIILAHKDLSPNSPKLLGSMALTHSHTNSLCQGGGNIDSLMMETDSEKLLEAGIQLAKENWEKTKKLLGWTNETPDWALGHQVTSTHEIKVKTALGLQYIPTHITYEHLGNTGASALPLTLHELSQTQKIQPGHKLALLGIGSGLSSIMMGIQW